MNAQCPFCSLPSERIRLSNDLAFSIRDAYPVAPGHTLVIPRRHVEDLRGATPAEARAIHELVLATFDELAREAPSPPDGYNVGVNCGAAAGQTIFHLHVHIIPRRLGDVTEPRGGIRKLMPNLVPYP